MSSSETNPTQRINELYWGFVISRAIHVAAKLGIADHVSGTAVHAKDIAKHLSLNEDRLYRLMRLLASYGIFEETDKGMFLARPIKECFWLHRSQVQLVATVSFRFVMPRTWLQNPCGKHTAI